MNIYLAGAMPGGVEKHLKIYLAGTERIRRDAEVVSKGGEEFGIIFSRS